MQFSTSFLAAIVCLSSAVSAVPAQAANPGPVMVTPVPQNPTNFTSMHPDDYLPAGFSRALVKMADPGDPVGQCVCDTCQMTTPGLSCCGQGANFDCDCSTGTCACCAACGDDSYTNC